MKDARWVILISATVTVILVTGVITYLDYADKASVSRQVKEMMIGIGSREVPPANPKQQLPAQRENGIFPLRLIEDLAQAPERKVLINNIISL